MFSFFGSLFDGSDFPARWHCGNWSDPLGWLHIGSDLAIFAAYTAIPVVLVQFIRKKRDVPFHGIFFLFGMFILACGTSHLNEAIIFWNPIYRWAGLVKAVTAVVSWATVIALVPALRAATNLRTPAELEKQVRLRTEQLNAAQRRFEIVVEASPSAMLMVDQNRKMVLVNNKSEELFGYSRAELLGSTVDMLVPLRFGDRHPEFVRGFFAEPSARAMGAQRELFGRRKDGTEIPIEIGLNPIDTPDGLHVIASIIDISERKLAETRILEAQTARTVALKRSNDELEQYAYVASHDLQEPLRMVSSYMQLLKEDYEGKLDANADAYIRFAVDGAQRMNRMLQDLLAYSRVQSRELTFSTVDTANVLQLVLSNLALSIKESGATIRADPLPTITCNAALLEQLFQNLIANALKFRRADPPLIHVSATHKPPYWQFSVKDNGLGIDEKHFERVFSIFKRLHTADEYPGSGIGLAVCQKVVDRHGGRIWIESTPGQGSTFIFTLLENPRK